MAFNLAKAPERDQQMGAADGEIHTTTDLGAPSLAPPTKSRAPDQTLAGTATGSMVNKEKGEGDK